MSKHKKSPELIGLTKMEARSIWIDARRGNESAKQKLFRMTLINPAITGWFSFWAKQASDFQKQVKPKESKYKPPPGQWERAKNNMLPSGAVVVSGGLPSLGKRR